MHRPRNSCLLVLFLRFYNSVLCVASNVALIPYQPGFSRDIYYFLILISYIYLINRYLQVNFLVPLRSHRFDPYLKNLHLTRNYLRHRDQFPISTCFQSFWSALFSAVSSPISTTMHYLPRQSVYRQHHSTETAVLRVVTDIRVALDVGHVSLLLLDMSAAFDTADHDILIARLDKTFAVRQTPLQWFRTYLSGSSQMILSSSSRNFKQRIRRSTGLCTGTNSLLPVCFRHCGYRCRPWSLQPQVCR